MKKKPMSSQPTINLLNKCIHSLRKTAIIGACLSLLFVSPQGEAALNVQTQASSSQVQISSTLKPLDVGIVQMPPFVILGESAKKGLSLDLWQDIALKMERKYVYKPYDTIPELLKAVDSGQIDVGVGALSVTSKREESLDFTHSFFRGGPAIATHSQSQNLMSSLLALFSWEILNMMSMLMGVLLFLGFILWWVEKRHASEDFDKGPVKGIAHGFWLSAVTLTTVGFGEKAPETLLGRSIALFWMFTSVVLISSVTATITSTMTLQTLNSQIKDFKDLKGVKVGSVIGSTSDQLLNKQNIVHQNFSTIVKAMELLNEKKLDAVVYDQPALDYIIAQKNNTKLVVLPQKSTQENYAFVVRNLNPLREQINQVLLQELASAQWQYHQKKYFH